LRSEFSSLSRIASILIENCSGIASTPNYKNAQRLTIDGTGVSAAHLLSLQLLTTSQHTLIATQNTCGYAKVRAYFQTGALPGNDSYCPLERGPFGIVLNGTLEENIQQAGLADLVH
jgi:hypothetical protein